MFTLQLSGWVLWLIIVGLGVYFCWSSGFRALLSTTIMSVLAYLVFVGGGGAVLGYLNNIYVNIPVLLAVFTGGNVQATQPWQPIAPLFELSLGFRIVGFIVVSVLVPWLLNRINFPGWYKPTTNDDFSKRLGQFNAASVIALWISASTAFWQEYVATGGSIEGELASAMSSLPDLGVIPLFLNIVFIVVLLVALVQRVPKIWSA